jgi:hypothetical protein
VEMALKIFSLGFGAYWMEGQNKFDFVITWTICKCNLSSRRVYLYCSFFSFCIILRKSRLHCEILVLKDKFHFYNKNL